MTLTPVVRHNYLSIRQVLRTTGPVTCPTTNRRSPWIPEVPGLNTPFAALVRQTSADRMVDPCPLLEHNIAIFNSG